MTKATRAESKLDQLLGRLPTAGLSVSSGHPDARYLRGGTQGGRWWVISGVEFTARAATLAG